MYLRIKENIEYQIIKEVSVMQEKVSIIMLAYNHDNWIANAIESIINQETNFKYRLYINDDASTDNTRSIIQKYENSFPDKIVGIYQNENQWSKGNRIISDILVPATNGKYIAICEGDDFWIDPHKLQRQFDYMEENKECSMFFSNAKVVGFENEELSVFLPQYVWNDKRIIKKLNCKEADFIADEMILLDFIPTASLMCIRNVYEDM